MADFLSDRWFEDLRARLALASPGALPDGARPCRLVVEFTEVPDGQTSSLTLTVSETSLEVVPGGEPPADAYLRIGFSDAAAIAGGDLDSATALRDGRIKVHGDVGAIAPLANWLLAVLGA